MEYKVGETYNIIRENRYGELHLEKIKLIKIVPRLFGWYNEYYFSNDSNKVIMITDTNKIVGVDDGKIPDGNRFF